MPHQCCTLRLSLALASYSYHHCMRAVHELLYTYVCMVASHTVSTHHVHSSTYRGNARACLHRSVQSAQSHRHRDQDTVDAHAIHIMGVDERKRWKQPYALKPRAAHAYAHASQPVHVLSHTCLLSWRRWNSCICQSTGRTRDNAATQHACSKQLQL